MENASKALIMAAGILLGVLIIALLVTLLLSSREMTLTYEKVKKEEAVEQFNANFTKYLGRDLTIHEVVTICNFANNNNIYKVKINTGEKNSNNIKDNLEVSYKLNIVKFSKEGYIGEISFK